MIGTTLATTAHADYFGAFAERVAFDLRTPDQLEAMRRAHRDDANSHASIAWLSTRARRRHARRARGPGEHLDGGGRSGDGSRSVLIGQTGIRYSKMSPTGKLQPGRAGRASARSRRP